ncbi:MAG: N-acyl-D-amino-acid deacylase [Parcubacteria group bacterium GW2011_GWD2_40_9]|nr:MAG: N-acyl-D-amino-acid deacylase [Parcubacteria group bacterium GW2011_GWD2_40_9]
MAKYSVIIKNGTVFDGTGKKPERIDIGVKDDEIKRLGDLQKETADTVIDASGKYVSPGFVDMTNHSDTHWSLFSQPNQESMITQGVTTAIGGSCGLSLAPFTGSFSKKEIGRWVDMSQVNISWQTMGEFLDVLERRALGLNFGSFAGLDTIISSFKSDDDFSKKIKFLMESSLKDGAIGVSFNFGVSLQKKLNKDEIIGLFNFLSKAKVVSKIHLENEGKDVLPVKHSKKDRSQNAYFTFKSHRKGRVDISKAGLRYDKKSERRRTFHNLRFFPLHKDRFKFI